MRANGAVSNRFLDCVIRKRRQRDGRSRQRDDPKAAGQALMSSPGAHPSSNHKRPMPDVQAVRETTQVGDG